MYPLFKKVTVHYVNDLRIFTSFFLSVAKKIGDGAPYEFYGFKIDIRYESVIVLILMCCVSFYRNKNIRVLMFSVGTIVSHKNVKPIKYSNVLERAKKKRSTDHRQIAVFAYEY